MKLSIVTTLYMSAPYVAEFYRRIKEAAAEITDDYELIWVDDGSPDDAAEVVKQFIDSDPKTILIELSRNFGHHKAIMTGIEHARGDNIFVIDCDLEEAPELIIRFWEELHDKNNPRNPVDIVCGVQTARKGGWFERTSGTLFFRIVNSLSNVHITPNPLSTRMMTRRFVDKLLTFREHELVYLAIEALTGYNRKIIAFDKQDKGSSTYSFSRKLQLAIRYVTSLSSQPLLYILYLGCSITGCSGLIGLYLICNHLFGSVVFPAWTSVMLSIWLLGGLLIVCIGIVGIYISVILTEVKDRPYTIVRDKHNMT